MPGQNFFQRRFDTWLERRLPRVEAAALNSKSLFTFPSRAGFGFLLVLVILWLLATNYENNIVFGVGALLGAVMVVAIFHSFANLSGLQVRVKAIGAGFPGDKVRVDLELSQGGKRVRDDILLAFPGGETTQVSFPRGEKSVVATLFVPARRRGRLVLERLSLESTYPLGLIRVWTHILLAGSGVIYPRPLEGEAVASGGHADRSAGDTVLEGREDFEGLKSYRPGESISRIAWKQVARGQGMYTKDFSDPVADPQWLDWQHYPGMDREARLSRLCHDVLEAAKSGEPFGLRLPGQELALSTGINHRDNLLTALALFEAGEG